MGLKKVTFIISIFFLISEIVIFYYAHQEINQIRKLIGSARAQSELNLLPLFILCGIIVCTSVIIFILIPVVSLKNNKLKKYLIILLLLIINSLLPPLFFYFLW